MAASCSARLTNIVEQTFTFRAERRPDCNLVEPLIDRERDEAVRPDRSQRQRNETEHDEHESSEPLPRQRRSDDVGVDGIHGGDRGVHRGQLAPDRGDQRGKSSFSERTTTAILRIVHCSCGI